MKIYLIAGEPSGDLLGSRLMRALVKKTGGQVEFHGLGGDTMESEGLKRQRREERGIATRNHI